MSYNRYSYYSAPPTIATSDLRNWVVRRQISDRFTGLFAEKEQSYKQRYVDTYLDKPELAELRQRLEDCPPMRDAGHLLETLRHLYDHRALTFHGSGNVRINVNMFNNSRADRELLSALVTFAGAAQSLEGEPLKEKETNKKFPSGMVNLRYENGLEIELGFIAAQGLEGFARSQMKPKELEKQYNSEIHSLIRSADLSIDEAVASARRQRQEAVTNARGNVERKKAELELKELEFGAVRDWNPFYRNFHLGLLRVDVTNAAQGLWNQTVGRLTGAHVTAPGPVRHMIKMEQRETELVREKISEARTQLNAAMGEVNRAYEETVKEIYEKYKVTPPVETKFSTLGEYASKRFAEPFQKGAKKLAKDIWETPGKMAGWGGEKASGMAHMVADPIGDMIGGIGERVQRGAQAIGQIPGELLNRLEGQPRGEKLEEFLALKQIDPEKAREMLSIPARQRDIWRDARALALDVTRDAVREGLPSYMVRMLPERNINPRDGSPQANAMRSDLLAAYDPQIGAQEFAKSITRSANLPTAAQLKEKIATAVKAKHESFWEGEEEKKNAVRIIDIEDLSELAEAIRKHNIKEMSAELLEVLGDRLEDADPELAERLRENIPTAKTVPPEAFEIPKDNDKRTAMMQRELEAVAKEFASIQQSTYDSRSRILDALEMSVMSQSIMTRYMLETAGDRIFRSAVHLEMGARTAEGGGLYDHRETMTALTAKTMQGYNSPIRNKIQQVMAVTQEKEAMLAIEKDEKEPMKGAAKSAEAHLVGRAIMEAESALEREARNVT